MPGNSKEPIGSQPQVHTSSRLRSTECLTTFGFRKNIIGHYANGAERQQECFES